MATDRDAAKVCVSHPLDRLDRRLQRLLRDAETDLDHYDLMVFADKFHVRYEAFRVKHVYPVFRERMESRRGR